ncbi:hypothetical protein [Paenibacillus sp. 1781tsa1]|uniref:hypothetical protein n=1 Tax=Paenibacillus sp. 1781tsa1 TaxID=2953810 RepID=UPI00209D6988|nr:hypothetical protein [Paenibacillus sp. 1781tsa1]MCP1185062.1 hypothetical protein [Paenibacillus sp. 1781tsa1]
MNIAEKQQYDKGVFYSDYDVETDMYGVFHTDYRQGHCFGLFLGREEANIEAKERNDTRNYLIEGVN